MLSAQSSENRSGFNPLGFLKDHYHGILDGCGLIDVVGTVCDLANAAAHAIEGNYDEAGLSAAGAIPFIGTAITTSKYAIKGTKAASQGLETLTKYDADFALSQIMQGGRVTAKQLDNFGSSQGWVRSKASNGPVKYMDSNGITRLTIKRGSQRAPGSEGPHVEMRNMQGHRVDSFGNAVTRRSPGNHTAIDWDF